MSVLSIIPYVFSIRDASYSHIDAGNNIDASSVVDVHKQLLSTLANKSIPLALVFQNELLFSRNLEDINNNEIKSFLETNSDWDILILGKYSQNDVTVVDGFSRIYRIANTSQFQNELVYIASARFMNKIKNNESSFVKYVYSPSFIENIQVPMTTHNYVISKIDNVIKATGGNLKYVWSTYALS